jgi:hypothetical protein
VIGPAFAGAIMKAAALQRARGVGVGGTEPAKAIVRVRAVTRESSFSRSRQTYSEVNGVRDERSDRTLWIAGRGSAAAQL